MPDARVHRTPFKEGLARPSSVMASQRSPPAGALLAFESRAAVFGRPGAARVGTQAGPGAAGRPSWSRLPSRVSPKRRRRKTPSWPTFLSKIWSARAARDAGVPLPHPGICERLPASFVSSTDSWPSRRSARWPGWLGPAEFDSRRDLMSKKFTRRDCIEALQNAADEFGEPLKVREWRESDYRPSDRTIADRFGGWNEAKEAAGLECVPHGQNEGFLGPTYQRVGCRFETDDGGYEMWEVNNRGTQHRILVHRLVAISEHGADQVAERIVHHKNNIPWDNRPENLELMDRAEHARLHQLRCESKRDNTGRFV